MKNLKRKIRSEIRAAIDGLGGEALHRKSDIICRRLAELDEFINAKCVMVYLPMVGEIHLGTLAREAWQAGKIVCAPTSPNDREMRIIEIKPADSDLFDAKMGLRSPIGREIHVSEIDLIIVPALAFSPDGGRLGRGGGFYDRFLARHDLRAKKIGAAFREQIRPVLPMDNNDIPVDRVITDAE